MLKLFCGGCFHETVDYSSPHDEEIVWDIVKRPLTEEQHGWMESALNTVEWEWSTTRWPEGAEL